MLFQLQLGVSKKTALASFGSLGAQCQLQLELDGGLLHESRSGAFHQETERLYALCTQAVDAELMRAQAAALGPASIETVDEVPCPFRGATARQLRYAQQLARQCAGAAPDLVDAVAHERFAKSPVDLSTGEASELIDLLRELRAGRLDLARLVPAPT